MNTRTATAVVSVAILVGLASSATATSEPAPAEVVTSTVTVTGMVDSSVEPAVGAPAPTSQTFVVTGTPDTIDALVASRIHKATTRSAGLGLVRPGGAASANKISQLGGTCGDSWVELRATGSYVQGQGYLRAGWQLNPAYVRSAGAFTSDVLVYSNSALDGYTSHFAHSGTSGMRWERDTRITVPKKQEYGAHMTVGQVAIVKAADGQPGSCITRGPRVDNVVLFN
jgi:hypothetical protein